MGSPLDAHTRLGTDRGDRRAGRDPGLLGAAERPKNTSPERRFPLEELTGLSETPGSQGRIPGSRRLIPIRAGAHLGAQGCPVGGSDAGDALRVGLRQDMPSCWGLGGTGGFCPPNQRCLCCQDRCWDPSSSWLPLQPAGGMRTEAQGHPRCSRPLRQWLRISTARAYPLILLPARQLPWREPRSTSCRPLPCLRPSSQPSLSQFPHSRWKSCWFPQHGVSGKASPAWLSSSSRLGQFTSACASPKPAKAIPSSLIPDPTSLIPPPGCPLPAFPQGWGPWPPVAPVPAPWGGSGSSQPAVLQNSRIFHKSRSSTACAHPSGRPGGSQAAAPGSFCSLPALCQARLGGFGELF